MTRRQQGDHLDRLLAQDGFAFAPLQIEGIDNGPVIRRFGQQMAREETCLMHRDAAGGDGYLQRLHTFIEARLSSPRPGPVVRFADGEYAFYRGSLDCNGLYRQADSKAGIRRAIPFHVAALKTLVDQGLAAPLIFPGNTDPVPAWPLSWLNRRQGATGGRAFLRFLDDSGIILSAASYLPFYVVYAYLTSPRFAALVDGRRLCLVNADWNADACERFFERRGARPRLSYARIPDALVAVHWPRMRDALMTAVPRDADIFLVGAGVGALPVCVDLAVETGRPVIDAGHVVNMMNDMAAKSNGARMYSLWAAAEGGP